MSEVDLSADYDSLIEILATYVYIALFGLGLLLLITLPFVPLAVFIRRRVMDSRSRRPRTKTPLIPAGTTRLNSPRALTVDYPDRWPSPSASDGRADWVQPR